MVWPYRQCCDQFSELSHDASMMARASAFFQSQDAMLVRSQRCMGCLAYDDHAYGNSMRSWLHTMYRTRTLLRLFFRTAYNKFKTLT